MFNYEQQLQVVDWYMDVLESGIDTKDIAREFGILKKEHLKLKKTSARKIEGLTDENHRLSKKLRQVQRQLTK